MSDLKDRMSKGAVSVAEVEAAFKSATSEGGLFYGMLDKQSKTLTGSLSTLQDAFDTFLGQTMAGASDDITELFVELAKFLNYIGPAAKIIGDIFGVVVKAITLIIQGFNAINDAIKFINDWNVSINRAMGIQVDENNNLVESQKKQIENLKKIKDLTDPKNLQAGFEAERLRGQAIQKLAIQTTKAREAELAGLELLKKTGLISAKEYLQAKMKFQQEILDGIEKEIQKTGKVTDAQKLEIEKRLGYIKGYADQILEIDDNSQAAIEKRRIDGLKRQEELHKAYVLMVEDSIASTEAESEATAAAQEKAARDSLESWDGFYDHLEKKQLSNLDMIIRFTDIFTSAFSDAFMSLGKALVEGKDGWAALGSAGVKAIANIVKAIGDQLTAMAAFETIKATIMAFNPLTAALAPGVFAGAGIAAAGAAAAYATAGAISAFGDSIKGYAMGTDFMPTSGTKLVGEMGPELVQLPQGSKVFSNARTEGILDKMQGVNITNNYYSPENINAIEADRLARRSAREMRLAF
jgi:hypothetical protein